MILRRYTGVMPIERLDSERAYDRLVQLIQNGLILEEQPLSKRKLADKLGFGRTPIREAIKGLARDGVLESHPPRGPCCGRLRCRTSLLS